MVAMSRSTPDRGTQRVLALFTRVNCDFDGRGRYNQGRGHQVAKLGECLEVGTPLPLLLRPIRAVKSPSPSYLHVDVCCPFE